ncbi:MAG TPA: hypothetical protein VJR92_15165 [Gemmatimonadaceae bacterium]|nr:hypothetical protein [Gemmatimonadaceae bacterium]
MKKALALSALLFAAACKSDNGELVPDYRVLSPEGARHDAPSYSRDGTKLAWWAPATDGTPNWQVWVANADQTNARALPVSGGGATHLMWSPDDTKIATASNNFGFVDIVVVTVADGAVKRVTQGAGVEVPISWHPDNDRLTYYGTAEGGSIRSYAVKTSTGETRRLVAEETRPMVGYFSPDGSKIAYLVGEGPKFTLWVADSMGRGRREITKEGFETFGFGGGWGNSPWSPDGKEILYESRRTGTSDLWIVSVADGAARQLTRDVRNDFGGAWSPDGKSIAFISDRGRQVEVWVADAASGVEHRVTDNYVDEGAPVWRGGTNELAYISDATESNVVLRNIADGSERKLTPDSIQVPFFNLTPDGTQFDYIISRGGATHELAVAPLAGGASRTLIAGGGDIIEANWSPDGTKIAFQSQRGGTPDIWVIDAAGGAPRQLVNLPSGEFGVGWSMDSKSVYFASDRDARLSDIWMVPVAGGEPVRVSRDGSIGAFIVGEGRAEVYASIISAKDGSLTWGLVRPNGTLRPLFDGASVVGLRAPRVGDSIAIVVVRPGAGLQPMLISLASGRGRDILARDEGIGPWSPDGKQLVYYVASAGANDVGILDVATGKKTRLTTTPQSENGTEWTPDGKNLVFRRTSQTLRIHNSDLSSLLQRR